MENSRSWIRDATTYADPRVRNAGPGAMVLHGLLFDWCTNNDTNLVFHRDEMVRAWPWRSQPDELDGYLQKLLETGLVSPSMKPEEYVLDRTGLNHESHVQAEQRRLFARLRKRRQRERERQEGKAES